MTAVMDAIGRQRPDLRRWKRRSRMIAVFRRLLPTAIAALIIALAAQVAWNSILSARGALKDQSAPIRMIKPRFQGREGNGRSYVIAADTATRDERNLRRVTLDNAVVTLGVDTPKPTRVTANIGVYTEGDPIVHLSGDVQVDDGSGYHFSTENAALNTQTNVVEANSPLVGAGPIGEISSQSYGVYNDGDRMVFKGQVKARIK